MSARFTCPVGNCDDSFNELRLLLFHVRHEHYVMQYAPGLCCKVSGYGIVTQTYETFRKHMSRKHQFKSPHSSSNDSFQNSATNFASEGDHTVEADSFDLNIADTSTAHEVNTCKFYEQFFQFCLMLKEKHILSFAVYHDIMKHLIKMLSQLHCYCVEENTAETLEQPTLIDFDSMWASMKKVSM